MRSRCYQYKHLRFRIAHREFVGWGWEESDKASQTTKYRLGFKEFYWDITRPEVGGSYYSTVCPHCGQTLKLGIASLEAVAGERGKARRAAKALAISTVVLLTIGLIPFIFFAIADKPFVGCIQGDPEEMMVMCRIAGGVILFGAFTTLMMTASAMIYRRTYQGWRVASPEFWPGRQYPYHSPQYVHWVESVEGH